MRLSENLQRFVLCCTLCCTEVALRCSETPQFLLHRCPMQGLVPSDRCARNPVQRKAPGRHPRLGEGLYAAPLGMETRRMVLVPRGGSSLVASPRIPCSWPAICIDLSDTLDRRQIRTQRSSCLNHLSAPYTQSISLAAHEEMLAELDRTLTFCNVAWQICASCR